MRLGRVRGPCHIRIIGKGEVCKWRSYLEVLPVFPRRQFTQVQGVCRTEWLRKEQFGKERREKK